ncbi:MAG: extracellular solute-binding protein [Tenericutes bacterium]|nr:extracellular solute-binding protein [Mycoplasmatota bacterium]
MSKKIFIILIAMIAAFCSMTTVRAESSTTIKVWFSQYKSENEALEQIAENYRIETGINVEVISRINIFNAANDLVNNSQLEDRPDIVFMQAPDIGGLIKSNVITNVNDYLDIEELSTRYSSIALDAFKYNGEIYGVGYSIDSYGLIYNKDLISEDELPTTWDEFFETAQALTVVDNDGVVETYGTLLNSKDIWFNYPIIKTYGGYYYGQFSNGDYNAYDIGLNNQGMNDYIEMMKGLMDSNLILTNKIHTESEIVSRFSNGKVAMILYGLWYSSMFKERGINYGIASLPDASTEEVSKALTTVQGFVINNYSLQKESAADFLAYVLADENQQLLIEAGNEFDEKLGTRNPANISVINSVYIQSDTILQSLSSLNDECEAFPNIPEGPIWYNYTPQVLQTIFFGENSGDEVNTQEKLDELVAKIAEDVQLINFQAERIDMPDNIFLYLGLLVIAIFILMFTRKKIQLKKKNIHSKKRLFKSTILAWLLMLPLLILLTIFYLYPIVHNFYLSLTDYSGINMLDYGVIGLANYKNIFVAGLDGLVKMVIWTLCFAICVVTLSFVVGSLLAVFLDSIHFRIAKIYRIIYILPWVIPTVITLLMWQGLLETEFGLVNQFLSIFGISNIPWLENAQWARISTILVMTWFSFPYFMIVSSGMIKLISKDLYDAAKMDGANFARQFIHITLPLIFRAMIPTLIMSFIMQFNQFGVYILTAGGPSSDQIGAPGATDLLITYVFNTAFNTKRYAVAAAYSVIIFVFVGIFALTAMKVNKKRMEV